MSDYQEPLNEEQLVTSELAPSHEEPIAPAIPPPVFPEEPIAPAVPPPIFPEEPPEPSFEPHRPRRQPPSLFWPIILIGAGVVLILVNQGYARDLSWGVIWRLWPLLIIALGVDLLIGRRSVLGAIVSAVLLLVLIGGIVLVAMFAQSIPGVSDWVQPLKLPQWIQQTDYLNKHVEYPLSGVEQATVYIDWISVPGYLSALEDSRNLIEGDIDYVGELTFDVNMRGDQANVRLDSRSARIGFWAPDRGDGRGKRWDVELSPDVPVNLTLDAGSGPCDLDLAGLQVSGLVIDTGSGPVDLALPSGSSFEARIDGGSGPISITLPRNVGMRVELDSGSGPFSADSRFELVRGKLRGDGTWETLNYDVAEPRIVLAIDQGSGPVSIR